MVDFSDCELLVNVPDPDDERFDFLAWHWRMEKEEANEARERLRRWLRTKTIGPPGTSLLRDVNEQQAEGFIGVYYCPDRGDEPRPVQEFFPEVDEQVDDVTWLRDMLRQMHEIMASQLDNKPPEWLDIDDEE